VSRAFAAAQPPLEALHGVLGDRRQRLVMASYWLVAFVILLNLNGVLSMGAGVEMGLSGVILLACLAIIVPCGNSPQRVLGSVGGSYFAFLAVYVLIGLAVGMTSNQTDQWLPQQLYQLAASALTIYAAAAAARHALLAYGQQKALWPVALCSAAVVGTVFLGALWPQLYDYLPRRAEQRHSGFFANPNEAGAMAAITSVFALGCLHTARRRSLYLIILGMSGIAAVLTFSRTAILVFMAVLACEFLMMLIASPAATRGHRKWIVGLAALLAGALLIWFVVRGIGLLGPLQRDQQRRIDSVRELMAGRQIDRAFDNRREVYRAGLRAWAESPLVGNGLGSALELDLGDGRQLGPHNTWLLVLAEAGIVPAVFLLAFCLVWLRAALCCPMPAVRSVALGLFVVFVLVMMTSHVTLIKRYINLPLGTVIGLLAGANELARRRKKWLRHL
jgi:O-antigen ligase